MGAIRDIDIRDKLKSGVLKSFYDDDSKIIEELGILWGSNRADIAVVNGELWCYEIKSEVDTFYRLQDQLEAYGKVFDRISLVVHEKHQKKLESMNLPEHIGTYIVAGGRNSVAIEESHPPTQNNGVEAYYLANLLWRQESIEILQANGICSVSGLRRKHLCDKLAEVLPLKQLQQEVRDTLKNRQGWRVAL